MPNYPQDEDGEVLAQLEEMGVDLNQPLDLEFMVAAEGADAAEAIRAALAKKKYDVAVVYDEGEPDSEGEIEEDDEEFGPSWTVYVKRRMVPKYDEIVRIQKDLDATAEPLGGFADGWGAMLGEEPEEE
jgi:hypothetical protein